MEMIVLNTKKQNILWLGVSKPGRYSISKAGVGVFKCCNIIHLHPLRFFLFIYFL